MSEWMGDERRHDADGRPSVADQLGDVRNDVRFIKRMGSLAAGILTVVVIFFSWMTRQAILSEAAIPRLENRLESHMDNGGHPSVSTSLAEIKVELVYLREQMRTLEGKVENRPTR